jgi:hypothetical protein
MPVAHWVGIKIRTALSIPFWALAIFLYIRRIVFCLVAVYLIFSSLELDNDSLNRLIPSDRYRHLSRSNMVCVDMTCYTSFFAPRKQIRALFAHSGFGRKSIFRIDVESKKFEVGLLNEAVIVALVEGNSVNSACFDPICLWPFSLTLGGKAIY